MAGAIRSDRKKCTTVAEPVARPADLVERDFTASTPNRLWVADLIHIPTRSGFVYAGFVISAYSRMVVGWRLVIHLHADLVLDMLEMAIWRRGESCLDGLVHHSDRDDQYLAIRYTEWLAGVGAVASAGSEATAMTTRWPRPRSGYTRPS
ncbi:hypothetical protein GCM10018953_18120 [Streptosporangium nondiastaticum]